MSSRAALLVDVGPPYADALTARAANHGLDVARVEGDRLGVPSSGFSLYVIAVHGNDEVAYERVRSLCKAAGTSPVVVLARDIGIDTVVRLIHLGVGVLDLSGPPEDLAARIFTHLREPDRKAGLEEIVGESQPMRDLARQILAVAPTQSTVLLTGETGTGKGLIARVIRNLSRRREAPFIHVDCAALSPTVIESELFGHERGAFTSAAWLRRGRFELANGGTLFLDEIGDLELSLQAKLLRVLQDREYERVGGMKTLVMDARVIAATTRELQSLVREGRFRADLYFRLNVFHLPIPPLRERLVDIHLLVRAGLEQLGNRLGVPVPSVSARFYERLMTYRWPGNVRELLNLLERLLIQQRVEVLEAEDLDGLLPNSEAPGYSEDAPLGAEREFRRSAGLPPEADPESRSVIAAALVETGGNVARAARRLGIARSTLRHRIRQYGLGHLVPRD
jgi:transcriptional regulator with GAF, ATPase, and Fis domain